MDDEKQSSMNTWENWDLALCIKHISPLYIYIYFYCQATSFFRMFSMMWQENNKLKQKGVKQKRGETTNVQWRKLNKMTDSKTIVSRIFTIVYDIYKILSFFSLANFGNPFIHWTDVTRAKSINFTALNLAKAFSISFFLFFINSSSYYFIFITASFELSCVFSLGGWFIY